MSGGRANQVSSPRLSLLVLAAAIVVAGVAAPSDAAAAKCARGFVGGGPSTWGVDAAQGQLHRGALRDLESTSGDAYRASSMANYGVVEIDGSGYDKPQGGCSTGSAGQSLGFPADVLTFPGLEISPKLYVDPRRPFGREYVLLRNATGAPITVDVAWDGNMLMNASEHELHVTSSGDATVNAADRWATSCQDVGNDGCLDVVGETGRLTELAFNFEGPAGEESPVVTLADNSNDYQVTFTDVTIPAGQARAYMQIVSMSRNIGKAVQGASAIDTDPAAYGVFKGLSKTERKRLRNW